MFCSRQRLKMDLEAFVERLQKGEVWECRRREIDATLCAEGPGALRTHKTHERPAVAQGQGIAATAGSRGNLTARRLAWSLWLLSALLLAIGVPLGELAGIGVRGLVESATYATAG